MVEAVEVRSMNVPQLVGHLSDAIQEGLPETEASWSEDSKMEE